MKFSIKTTDKLSTITIQINLENELIDGGVYIFLIDDIPLYIGEANYFLDRLSTHLGRLFISKNKFNPLDYFGLTKLTGNHVITYMILESKLPYKKQIREGMKRASDINKKARTDKEDEYIEKYHPLTQWPIWLSKKDITSLRLKNRIRGKDHMLPIRKRNDMVYMGINQNSDLYNPIKKQLNTRKDYKT